MEEIKEVVNTDILKNRTFVEVQSRINDLKDALEKVSIKLQELEKILQVAKTTI